MSARNGRHGRSSAITRGPAKSSSGWLVFVSQCTGFTDADTLLETFRGFGSIRRHFVPSDRSRGGLRGYAMLQYQEKADAEAAIASMDCSAVGGIRIRCDWAVYSDRRSGDGR